MKKTLTVELKVNGEMMLNWTMSPGELKALRECVRLAIKNDNTHVCFKHVSDISLNLPTEQVRQMLAGIREKSGDALKRDAFVSKLKEFGGDA